MVVTGSACEESSQKQGSFLVQVSSKAVTPTFRGNRLLCWGLVHYMGPPGGACLGQEGHGASFI